ncbi:MAG TPA: hypothetical protein VFD58_33555 [Blastocatellia bacterium]|nr:hypothetical protein [Blastocatellia bacterium]
MSRESTVSHQPDPDLQELAQSVIDQTDLNWKVLLASCAHPGGRTDQKMICHLLVEVRPGTAASLFILGPDPKKDVGTGWVEVIRDEIRVKAARYGADNQDPYATARFAPVQRG